MVLIDSKHLLSIWIYIQATKLPIFMKNQWDIQVKSVGGKAPPLNRNRGSIAIGLIRSQFVDKFYILWGRKSWSNGDIIIKKIIILPIDFPKHRGGTVNHCMILYRLCSYLDIFSLSLSKMELIYCLLYTMFFI